MIVWDPDENRTVDDLLRTRLRGLDPRTGEIKWRRRAKMIEFKVADKKWVFDRGHVHRVAIGQDQASIVIDGARSVQRLDALQVLAWRAYWPCPDPWCDACSSFRDVDGVGPLDTEVAGVVETVWFGCKGPTPWFYRATVSAIDLHGLLMRTRTHRHPTEEVADLVPQRLASAIGAVGATITVTNFRKSQHAMAEYFANVLAAVDSGGWNIAQANPRRRT